MIKLQKLLSISTKEIILEWVPAHVGIHGNNLADAAAKKATENEEYTNVKIHYYDVKPLIKTFVFQRWQSEWTVTNCPLQRLKPIITGYWKSAYRKVRKEEVVLARLRVGACLFLYRHHFDTGTPIDFCNFCNVRNTIFHILLMCPQHNTYRMDILEYLENNRLSHSINNILGDNFPSELIFKFLRNINYFNKI